MRDETCCHHIGYSFRIAARVILHASSHRQDNTHHSLCYTSRGALAGTRNSSMGCLTEFTHRLDTDAPLKGHGFVLVLRRQSLLGPLVELTLTWGHVEIPLALGRWWCVLATHQFLHRHLVGFAWLLFVARAWWKQKGKIGE